MKTELFQETADPLTASGTQAARAQSSPAASAPASGFRRKRYWVDWASQLPITTLVVLATLFFVVMFNVTLRDLSSARRDQIAESSAFSEQLQREDRDFHRSILALSGVFVLCVVVGTVVLTQRSAGPIQRIQTHLERISRGDLDHVVRLRSRDHFQALGETCNEMIRSLEERRRADITRLERLAQVADGTSSPGEARALAASLRAFARAKAQTPRE